MSDYTPTTEEVRDWIAWSDQPRDRFGGPESAAEAFDRWIAAHDAEVLAAAGVAPQPEPEYEYGNQVMFNTHTPIMPAPDRETAMKRAWLQPAFRRVKAGAWEPAPNQDGEK